MSKLSFRLRTLIVAVLTASLVGLGISPAAANDPAKYYDGRIEYSSVVNCGSIIWGNPYTEYGIGAYTGYFADPDDGYPQAGVHAVYLHVVVYGLGNPCPGGTYFQPEVNLPAGVSLVPISPSAPIQCFYDGLPMAPGDCPQAINPSTGEYFSNDSAHGHMWGVAQGHNVEFLFPIQASVAVSGSNAVVNLDTADGNSSPTLQLKAPLYFFGAGATPSVMYDAPSTYLASAFPPESGLPGSPKFGLISEGMVNNAGQTGWMFMDIGTSSGSYDPDRVFTPSQINNTASSWKMWTDWDEPGIPALVPGKRYFWRVGFDPGAKGGGDQVPGAEQSFVVPAQSSCQGQSVTVSLGLGELPTQDPDVILGTPGADRINGLGGDDVICGLGGSDSVDGGPGSDRIDAGAGNDTVTPITGDDVAAGGAGTDTLNYYAAPAGVRVDLAAAGAQATGGGGTDTLSGFENVVGTRRNDTLLGSAGANLLVGGLGNDVYNGRAGKDTVSFESATAAITVSLAKKGTQVTGQGTDRFAKIEWLVGGPKKDKLSGNAAANRIEGGRGADRLFGLGGKDLLVGGKAKDRCDGGAGRDKGRTCEVVRSIP